MARPRKELPTDVDKLKEMLSKLKDKETRLEADLALRKHPELERGIISVCIALHDVRKAHDVLKVIQLKSTDVDSKRVEQVKGLIALYEEQLAGVEGDTELAEKKRKFYRSKVLSFKDALKGLESGADKQYMRLQRDLSAAKRRLLKELETWADRFREAKFDFEYFLPALKLHIPEFFS